MITIVGPGATGTLLAARFLDAGIPVSLLARDAQQAELIRKEGLTLEGALERRLPPSAFAAIAPGKRLPAARILFICVKSQDTSRAARSARPCVGSGSAVVSLQNGLAHVGPLRRVFGPKAVFGVGHFAAYAVEATRTRYAGGTEIFLARRADNGAPAEAAREALARAFWKVKLVGDETRLLWTKLILNAAINPLGALSRRPNGDLAKVPALKELLLRSVSEGVAAARRSGIRPLRRRMDNAALELCRKTAGNLNSMFQDIEAGRPTEAEAILKPLLESAGGPGRSPTLHGLYSFVRDLSERA